MENSQIKKPNKYAALATYLIAVVCLLAGLVLPLFDGKNILAVQLPDALNKLANKQLITTDKLFNLSYNVDLFGLGKFSLDFMALTVVLYAAVTAISVIALIPVIISTKRGTRTAAVIMYIVETLAVAVLSVYIVITLQYLRGAVAETENVSPLSSFSYNMLIAFGGALFALILLNAMTKKKGVISKIILLLLSFAGLIALYDLSLMVPSLANAGLPSSMYSVEGAKVNGIGMIDILFGDSYKALLGAAPDLKSKAAMVFCTIAAIVALLNYFVDIIGLSTNARKAGHAFNLFRYGFEIIIIICLLITVAVSGFEIGLMLVVLAIAVLTELEISIGRFVLYRRNAGAHKEEMPEETDEQLIIAGAEPYEVKAAETEEDLYDSFDEPVEDGTLQMGIEDILAEPAAAEMQEPAAVLPAYENKPAPVQPAYEPTPAPVQPSYEPVQETPSPYGQILSCPAPPVYEAPAQEPYPYGQILSQPVSAYEPAQQPSGETRIYTINTIYGGPVDEFMKKLTNDEKIEFAKTFIEKSQGNTGNIPEYVIGGNNKTFFSSVFIYLGRIRGIISDGLLNKMYRELNML